ncbi:MAG: hypothetical protein NXI16_06155 [Alphaproteobacteria bacterium]|nr:hypothetical protein [Alphaproteobacteria bacterium]
MLIDWLFIYRFERRDPNAPDLKGYVPSDNSGVTIASGFDIGVRNWGT